MKLSMETYIPYMRFGDKKAIEIIKNAGFDCIDYSFYWDASGDDVLGDEYIAHAEKVRRILDNAGMICNQAHAPFDIQYKDPFDMSNIRFQKIARAMEAASIMGAEHIVVHAIHVPFGEDVMDYNVSFYKSLEPYCKKFGIKIAIENLFWRDEKSKCCRGRMHTPELLYEILDRLNSKWFVLCIDVGHAALVGIEPDEMIRRLDNKVLMALHIHDNNYVTDQHLLPFHGSLDWNKIMAALKDIHYKGDLTLEVFRQLDKYETEFLSEAIAFAGKIGKMLIRKISDKE